ncbi:Histidine phosphatase superfamily [Cinnamomum micranthum f. kanehirae]|uniref:Histidine phosphatase superfamily n=1 Tax=Cinnamomum micranthum f. kanehirae TaxID=337451 RepID=A0A443Q399_9MAGN|nr:Histidine phosphatase superfamily [Cinnamomum micranthum f. kanehirae]
MGCASLIFCSTTTPLPPPPLRWTVTITAHQRPWNGHCRFSTFRTFCSSANSDTSLATDLLERDAPMTGGAFDFKGATISLTNGPLSCSKKVTLIRHGLSTWNEESRIQGSSDLSTLTDTGAMQAEKCRRAIANLSFDRCFSSPISRAKSSAEIIWQGREQPLVFLDTLKEGHLFFLEGMKNEDARKKYPELYTAWREDPVNFQVDGIYPVQEIWKTAREAWREILSTPGEDFLVVTHKSILRALICTALGLGPVRFRAIDVNNCGISVFLFNKRGEAMLKCLNMTAHMHSDHFYNY